MQAQATEARLKEDILDILTCCINCRFCLPSCPLFEITQGEVTQGASGITRALYYAVKWNEIDREVLGELRNILYSCMTCRNCEVACKNLSTGTKLLDAIEKGRELLIEKLIGPMPKQKRTLESLYLYGNPNDMLPADRQAWLSGLNVSSFGPETDVLLYVGCTAPHDLEAQGMAFRLVELLKRAGIRFGIIGDEICCGRPALDMGESGEGGLFEDISGKNIARLASLGVKHVVTLSPHCFDTFRNRYPKEKMKGIKIQHYTQFLSDLIEKGQLKFAKSIEKKVVYHDPCYLGRYNSIYDEPRRVLESIPGLGLGEFARAREDSLCCGGGGGRMFTDFEAEIGRLGNIRAKEALDAGADTIVTACPWCKINLVDGVKIAGIEESVSVIDLAELCMKAL